MSKLDYTRRSPGLFRKADPDPTLVPMPKPFRKVPKLPKVKHKVIAKKRIPR